MGRLDAEVTLITMGFSTFFCISDNNSSSSVTEINRSSILPAAFSILFVVDFIPAKNVAILIETVAVPWIRACAARASSFLDGCLEICVFLGGPGVEQNFMNVWHCCCYRKIRWWQLFIHPHPFEGPWGEGGPKDICVLNTFLWVPFGSFIKTWFCGYVLRGLSRWLFQNCPSYPEQHCIVIGILGNYVKTFF